MHIVYWGETIKLNSLHTSENDHIRIKPSFEAVIKHFDSPS